MPFTQEEMDHFYKMFRKERCANPQQQLNKVLGGCPEAPPAPPPPLFKALSDLEHHIDELEVAIRGLQFRLSPIMESGDVAFPAPPAEHAASGGVVLDIERASYRLASLEGFVADIQARLHV